MISPKMTGWAQDTIINMANPRRALVAIWEGDRDGEGGSVRTNQNSAPDNGGNATAKTPIQNDGQSLVYNDVRQEQCDEHPVFAAVEKMVNAVRIFVLGFFVVEGDDAQVDLVLAHERDGQAGKGTAEEHEGHGYGIEHPQGTALGLGDVVMMIAGAEGLRVSRGGGGKTGEQSPGQA